jgi:HEXXH motif-containing protein
MNAMTHRLDSAMFEAICGGRGGPEAIRALCAAERSKAVLSVGAVVTLARRSGHPHHALAQDAYNLLREIELSAPDAVSVVLDYPTVSAWALQTALALTIGDVARAEPQRLATVAAAAAARAGVAARLRVIPSGDGRVALPSLGVARLPGEPGRVEFASGSAVSELVGTNVRVRLVEAGDGAWSGVPILRVEHDGLAVSLSFDHLDTSSPAMSIATVSLWQERIAAGWRILVERHRHVADEFVEAITLLAPMPDPAEGSVSATARHAFGAIAMSTPGDPRSVAVTLAHELQHSKLSAVMDLVPLVSAGTGGRYYTPWRSDPRPFPGVLQGVYAHLAIADFWRREMTDGMFAAQVEYARWRDAVASTATRLLDSDHLTDLGRRLVDGVLAEIGVWHDEVTAPAQRHADSLAREHRAQFERAHGPVV